MNLPGATDDPLATSSVEMMSKTLDKGLSSDYSAFLVITFSIAMLWIVLWRFGGLRELLMGIKDIAASIRDAVVQVKEIAEINERVITKSNTEYRELIERHRQQLDRSPTLRVKREAQQA